jgi:hypothetical protein
MRLLEAAVANNAEWCDLITRSHNLLPQSGPDAWTCRDRTPPLYPDAVTLVPAPQPADLLSRIDTSPGCTVKDSFASLDLAGYGFGVLFDADWISRPASTPAEPAPPGLRWRRITRPAGLARWTEAWQGPPGLLRASLLAEASVAVLAAGRDGEFTAGAILNTGAAVTGVTNVFSTSGIDPWPGLLSLAGSLFPAKPLVGYESGEDLGHAERHGFRRIGKLRVWIKET